MRKRCAFWLVIVMMRFSSELTAQMRPDVTGVNAAVVADHPLAAAAGADVLRRGGNAMDAAITMAAVLAVVRPHMNGVGGDAFILYREGKNGKLFALNGSGRAGQMAQPQVFAERGLSAVPDTGVLSVTIPGAVRAWADALRRFGSFGLAAALDPAIRYAEEGFPISPKLAADIEEERALLLRDEAMRQVFLAGDRAPAAGTLLRQRDLARTLRTIAEEGADVLYAGALAQRLAEFAVREGALFTLEDLAAHSSTWQEPITSSYHELKVVALPPNSQGVALLMQLNAAELLDVRALKHNSADYIHALVEIKKRVFVERDRYVSDPALSEVPLDRMLSRDRAREIARSVQSTAQKIPSERNGSGTGDTVVLCAVDRNGNVVVLIQSLFSAFGSGRMVPGTGIVLHNRGSLFSLDPAHVNVIAPGKRTYHTLSPAMVLRKDNSLMMAFATPGSDGQTQTLLQVLNNIYLFGMTPQQAVDAPRYRSYADGTLLLDAGVSEEAQAGLTRRGHNVRVQPHPSAELGGAQVILISPAGVRWVGADHRREAYGLAY
ncbi:MAG TPA: gamma-glutamyltransferase [Longimicrobiales bacterium]